MKTEIQSSILQEQKTISNECAPLTVAELAEFITREKREVNYEALIDPTVRLAAFGETHSRYGPKEEVIINLETFRKMGFTHVGLEYFGTELQEAIDDYCEGGTEESKQKLIQHLTDKWDYHPRFIDMCFQIIDIANKIGLRIIAINRKLGESAEKTDRAMAENVSKVFEQDPNNKIITLTGNAHVAKDNPDSFVAKLQKKYKVTTIRMVGGLKKGTDIFSRASGQNNTDQAKWAIPGPIYCDWIIHFPQQEQQTQFEQNATVLQQQLRDHRVQRHASFPLMSLYKDEPPALLSENKMNILNGIGMNREKKRFLFTSENDKSAVQVVEQYIDTAALLDNIRTIVRPMRKEELLLFIKTIEDQINKNPQMEDVAQWKKHLGQIKQMV